MLLNSFWLRYLNNFSENMSVLSLQHHKILNDNSHEVETNPWFFEDFEAMIVIYGISQIAKIMIWFSSK